MLVSLSGELLRSLRLTLVIAAVTGLIYPLAITGVAQLAFPSQANGSLVTSGGQVVGSKLIGQEFTAPQYFQGRPSATVSTSDSTKSQPYNAANSAGSNLGPSNQALVDRVAKSVQDIRQQDSLPPSSTVPIDVVTTDFSGFDPDISEAGALVQVHRVAGARGLSDAQVRFLVENHVQGRTLGVFGESHVNVLELNLILDGKQS